eukprot:2271043-Rhodomonas_salina.1
MPLCHVVSAHCLVTLLRRIVPLQRSLLALHDSQHRHRLGCAGDRGVSEPALRVPHLPQQLPYKLHHRPLIPAPRNPVATQAGIAVSVSGTAERRLGTMGGVTTRAWSVPSADTTSRLVVAEPASVPDSA